MRLGSFDLHCHSNCSDGEKTPNELIDMAKQIGLKGLSITDHDTVAAYTNEVLDYAKKMGVELITGVEFSTKYEKNDGVESIHILGYGVDIDNPKLLNFCNTHTERRMDRLHKMVQKLSFAGIDLKDFSIPKDKLGSVGRPHIALRMIELGYVKDMEEAFKKFIGEKAPYYVKSTLPTIQETLDVIKNAGGKSSLAHPILIKGKKVLKNILSTYDFDALECFYGNFQRDRIERLLKLAEEKNLLVTGGSDYHGERRAYVSLGCSFITEERVRALLSTF